MLPLWREKVHEVLFARYMVDDGGNLRVVRLCSYCGTPTLRQWACWAHRDLPALDPTYRRETKVKTT